MTREEERQLIADHVDKHGVTRLPSPGNMFPDTSTWSRGRRGRRKKKPETPKEKAKKS